MVLGTAVVQTLRSDTSASSNRSAAQDGGTAGGGVTEAATEAASPSAVPSLSPSTSASVAASPTPSKTPSRTPSQSRTTEAVPPAQASTGLRASHRIQGGGWAEGYVGNVSLSNPGTEPATWTVVIVLPEGAAISPAAVWNATVAVSGRTYTFSPSGGTPLGPGGTAQFGYQASRSAPGQVPESCKVNDRPCE
jgi:endoglucanase